MATFKDNPSPVRVGYLTLIHEDGSKEVLEVSTITKLRVKDIESGGTKIVIEADVDIQYRPAPPMPKYIYDLRSSHVGLYLNYGLIRGRIDSINAVETSDGRDNWSVCAVHVTVDGRDYRFNDNDPITVTRHI